MRARLPTSNSCRVTVSGGAEPRPCCAVSRKIPRGVGDAAPYKRQKQGICRIGRCPVYLLLSYIPLAGQDMKASLVFLNDAYQNSIELIKAVDEKPSNELEEFLELFMTTRDLFIRQLVDRYPSNYHDVEVQIQKLKAYSD